MSKSLDRVKRIIRELQQKTIENGCTEEEALAAAEKVGAMLQEHDLEMDDVGIRMEAAGAKKQQVFAADDYAGSICVGISSLCDLKVWVSDPGVFTFFGTDHDLSLGVYLYEICAEAMDIDWAKYMELYGYSLKKRASFRMGFAHRVCDRLREIKEARKAAQMKMSTATGLVVLKDQLVQNEFDKLGMKLRKSAPQRAADRGAYASGQASGERMNLNNPIGDGTRGSAQVR